MNIVDNKELKNINGGGISIGLAIGIGTAIVFVIGIIDGFVNPDKCKEGR